MQVVDILKRLMPRARDAGGRPVRAARQTSQDRALAAFKADLAKRAAKNTRHIPGERPSRRR